MKNKELIAVLERLDPESEVYRDEEQTVCTPVQVVAFECVRHIRGFGRNQHYIDEWIVILQ